jgi:hypothetical protein
MDHNHGGVVDDGGLHTPTINPDGYHTHDVTGSLSWTENSKYGFVVMSKYTDYEKDHKHTNVTSAGGSDHRHVNNPTDYEFAHTHSIPHTDGPDDTSDAITNLIAGSSCDSGDCVWGWNTDGYAEDSHWHYFTDDTGAGSTHRHGIGNTQLEGAHTHHIYPTGPGTYADPLGHRHLMSNDDLYQHYIYSITDVNLSLLVTAVENPYHAHTGNEIPVHKHDVPSDGRVLLINTNVTITYIAQEESS